MGDDGAEEIRAQVGDRAHEQAAGAAALDGDARRVAVAVLGQVLGGGDEVGEGVALLHACVPASCQGLPMSPPPRMCAKAITTPRSSRLRRLPLKPTGNEYP